MSMQTRSVRDYLYGPDTSANNFDTGLIPTSLLFRHGPQVFRR